MSLVFYLRCVYIYLFLLIDYFVLSCILLFSLFSPNIFTYFTYIYISNSKIHEICVKEKVSHSLIAVGVVGVRGPLYFRHS